MAGRNGQVSRIYCILDLLEGAPHGLTVTEIWKRVQERGHDASKRTVYRDLEALNASGFPLFLKEGSEETGRWALERNAKITQYLVLSCRELFALYFAKGALKPLEHTPFYSDLSGAFSKIDEKLGGKAKKHLKDFEKEVSFAPMPKWGLGVSLETLDAVRSACSEGQLLRVRYASASSQTDRVRKLGPHFIYFHKSSLYLVAEDLEDQKVKVFSVSRMKDAQMLDEPYSGVEVAESTGPAFRGLAGARGPVLPVGMGSTTLGAREFA